MAFSVVVIFERRLSGERWPHTCSVNGCLNTADVGAHVQKVRGSDRWYIIPLCSHHNNQRGSDSVVGNATTFISANKFETCGR